MLSEYFDRIVVEYLFEAYELNVKFDKDEGGQFLDRDEKLLDAIELLIDYFGGPNDLFKLETLKEIRESNDK